MTSTPWGVSQTSKKYAAGIISYSTANHGGFHLSQARQEDMQDCLRNENGWYEEDCEWCKVVVSFPDIFKHEHLLSAWDTLRNWHYRAYEKITGINLQHGESYTKDKALFFEKHKDNWVVISALRCEHDNTLVEVTATRGGKRLFNGQEKQFVVTAKDYDKRDRFGFVITDQDETVHTS
jgi:hypothetical protein